MNQQAEAIKNLIQRYRVLESLEGDIHEAVTLILAALRSGKKMLLCGNGGSASDAEHMTGELMKSFETNRPLEPVLKEKLTGACSTRGASLAEQLQAGIPALSLSSNSALTTAISNDMGADLVFAQQVVSIGKPGDVLVGFSTSGHSANVLNAMVVARAMGMRIIAFTGKSGGSAKDYCDVLINVPEQSTANIQELHLPVYHAICRKLEHTLFHTN